MNYIKQIIGFSIGVIITLLAVYFFKNFGKDEANTDYYILTNQISKMNKMVVLEQDFSSMQKTKITSKLLGVYILPSLEKQIVIFTKAKAQVSYDLKKMKLEVDSDNKKLIIKELPNADIKIFTDAEISSLDDSFFDRFTQEDFKRITSNAKKNAEKTVDQTKLRSEGRKQLLQNLNDIFVLAKALNYEIVDETKTLDLSKL
ncbi:hypothetical protein GCM10010992_01990 [Cloacibacterium rupense]|uniref:DUF4230 domain-containing protein n=1 Tax=Cloacibacterium rupense TaxID=517423 RepID=A0ABQ2NKG7_9FLAO|nr:DUF4230 domain-containing protein [Cloacibacterium rupense]GGP01475.1 hypothetical protein GCM10010992_01990 [Cloacibacterium rupense]